MARILNTPGNADKLFAQSVSYLQDQSYFPPCGQNINERVSSNLKLSMKCALEIPSVTVDLGRMRRSISDFYAEFCLTDYLQSVSAMCGLLRKNLTPFEPYALALAHLHVFSNVVNYKTREGVAEKAVGICTFYLKEHFTAIAKQLVLVDAWMPVLGTSLRELLLVHFGRP